MGRVADWWAAGRGPAALTASAVPASAPSGKPTGGGGGSMGGGWQQRVFGYERTVGEVRYAKAYHETNLGKLILVPQQLVDGQWANTEDPDMLDLIDRLRGPTGSFSSITGRYAALMFLVGQGQLAVMLDSNGQETWSVLSTSELRKKQGADVFEWKRGENAQAVDLVAKDPSDQEALAEGEVVVYNLWRGGAQYSGNPTSPMEPLLDVCEELLLTGRAIRARLRTRAAIAGILKVPTEISPQPVPTGNDDDALADPFLEKLVEALVTPITDETDVSALAPLVIRGQAEYLRELQHLRLADLSAAFPEASLRVEAINRFANGVDLPQEVVTGSKGLNHWSKWAVDDDTWQSHLQGVAEQLVADLTAILVTPTKGEGWRIWYDKTPVVNHPNEGQDANEMLDRGAIGYEAYRRRRGVTEDEAPSADDLATLVYVHSNGASAGDGTVEGSEDVTVGAPGAAAVAPPAAVIAASRIARDRCRDLAGSRIRSMIQQDPTRKRVVNGQANALVWSLLARKKQLPKDVDAAELVSGGAACMIDALQPFGVRRDVALMYARRVESEVARSMEKERG